MSRRWNWSWFMLAAAVVLADQASKRLVASTLPLGDGVAITSFFNVVHVLNPGAAFSLLAGAGGWQRYALAALGIAVSVWLARELQRSRNDWLACFAYAMIIGGALGNVLDRIVHGAVIDFLDLHWRGAHWPAFNVADMALCAGVTAMIAATLRPARQMHGGSKAG